MNEWGIFKIRHSGNSDEKSHLQYSG